MEPPQGGTPQESLDRLRLEVEELRASRGRLVAANDADRRSLERDLHDGPQQHLIALAVNLQLARQLADSDPPAATALLDEMGRDVQQALEETGRLAHRIYPPLLAAGGLAAALRAAAVITGVADANRRLRRRALPARDRRSGLLCCLDALERAEDGVHATVTVRDDDEALVFDILEQGAGLALSAFDGSAARSRDRVEALGGRLAIRPEPGGGVRVSGSLPLSR